MLTFVTANVLTMLDRRGKQRGSDFVGMNTTGRDAIVQRQFHLAGATLVGLQEDRRQEQLQETEFYTVVTSGATGKSTHGCALMIAQKFWDDRCLRNIDFTIAWRCVLPDAGQVDLRDVNLMERHFLAGLGYDLYIQPAKYSACLSEVLSIVVDEADPPPAAPPPTAPPPAAPPPGKP